LTRAFSLIWLSFQGIPQQLRQPGDIGGYAPDLVTNSAGTLLIPGIEAKLPFKAHPHMLRRKLSIAARCSECSGARDRLGERAVTESRCAASAESRRTIPRPTLAHVAALPLSVEIGIA